MIVDHFYDKWKGPPYSYPGTIPVVPQPLTPMQPAISPEEIAEFRKLLERARKYDKDNNEPDCELEEKKARLRALAGELGVDIQFTGDE
jgi:hypothetical protein